SRALTAALPGSEEDVHTGRHLLASARTARIATSRLPSSRSNYYGEHMKRLIATLSAILMFALIQVAVAEDLKSDLTALEKSLWTAASKKDPAPFHRVLTDDAVTVTAGGVLTGKEAIIKDELSCELRSFTLHDMQIHQLTPD